MGVKSAVAILLLCLSPCFLLAETQNYEVVPDRSSLNFSVSAQLHMVHGTGGKFQGTISGDPADITQANLSIQLDPATFQTGNDSRDKTMREKSLELDKYPKIVFHSTSIDAANKTLVDTQPCAATIHGTLTLHGIEAKLAVPVQILKKGDELTAEGDMALKLDDFKIFRPRVVFVKLQNDISIHFKITARKS